MNALDFGPIYLSLKLASLTTVLLLLLSVPLAWWFVWGRSKLRGFLEPLFLLPLFLPPTVLGFYLLLLLGGQGPLGKAALAFTFPGLVLASVLYSFPFALQPLRNSFAAIDKSCHDLCALDDAKGLEKFRYVIFPLSFSGFISAILLTFAHTMGEFGVVLMVGGAIPDKTRVASIALYDYVEALQYGQAHLYALVLIFIAFLLILPVYILEKQRKK